MLQKLFDAIPDRGGEPERVDFMLDSLNGNLLLERGHNITLTSRAKFSEAETDIGRIVWLGSRQCASSVLGSSSFAVTQNIPGSGPQAVAYASQAVAILNQAALENAGMECNRRAEFDLDSLP